LGRWLPGKRGSHEEDTVFGRADGKDSARSGSDAGGGGCEEARISDATIYLWRKRYGELAPVDVKRLRHLEQENGRLKKLVAERDLEIEVMKEIAGKKW
jgi:putative transposase